MNDDRTLERAARSFIEVGPTRAPEHAVQAALHRIQTTTQERGPLIPWRFPTMTLPARLAALAVVGGLVLVGLAMLGLSIGTRPTSTDAPSIAPASTAAVASSAQTTDAPAATPNTRDYSDLPVRILAEHLGNAADLSEAGATEYNPDTRRLYFMDPADMTPVTTVEFLPDQPAGGKSAADVSAGGTKVVFMDFIPSGAGPRTSLHQANLDGTGYERIPIDCSSCALAYPDYDPTASRIVYTRVEGDESWLEIRDLATGETTKLDATVGPADNAIPEQPAWSPDGTTIAFTRITWPADADPPIAASVHYGDIAPTSGVLSLLDVATGEVRDIDTGDATIPGDVQWAPDSASLVFADGPSSTTGSVGASFDHGVYRIGVDGSGLQALNGGSSPVYSADGELILYQSNTFWVVRPDGTADRPLNFGGSDLTDLAQGFIYVGHWLPPAP